MAPQLANLRETNFIGWLTGVVYASFGINEITGFFVFGLLAVIGSYLWYLATVDAVPFIDKRLYLGLVLFAPSVAFWPSSIGKESVMQLGIGAMALGIAYLLRQRLVMGLLVGAGGGWLLWAVRPHLFALVMVATGFAYLVGRVRPRRAETGSLIGRTVGLLIVGVLVAFAVGQGAKFLGIKDLSVSSVETTLDKQSARNTTGGSSYNNTGGDYLSPVNFPLGWQPSCCDRSPGRRAALSSSWLHSSLQPSPCCSWCDSHRSELRWPAGAAPRSCSTAGC